MNETLGIICFATYNIDSMNAVMDYLIDDLKMEDSIGIFFENQYLVVVLKKDYKKAVVLGHRYIVDHGIPDMFWVDYNNRLVKCGELRICYFELPKNRRGSKLWGIDQNLPKDIYSYLKPFKRCFGKEISVFQEYVKDDYENGFYITVKGMDYKKYVNDVAQFVQLHGLGPFSNGVFLTEYGAIIDEESFSYTKKLKR